MSCDEGTGDPYCRKTSTTEVVSCNQCGGKGYIKFDAMSARGSEDERRICLACDGKGWWEK